MKKIRLLIAALLVLTISISLIGCGKITSEELAGIWSGSWDADGDDIDATIVFDDDGNYAKVVLRNGEESSAEVGTVVIKGSKVILQKDGKSGVTTTYKYKGGALVNNGHKITKAE